MIDKGRHSNVAEFSKLTNGLLLQLGVIQEEGNFAGVLDLKRCFQVALQLGYLF